MNRGGNEHHGRTPYVSTLSSVRLPPSPALLDCYWHWILSGTEDQLIRCENAHSMNYTKFTFRTDQHKDLIYCISILDSNKLIQSHMAQKHKAIVCVCQRPSRASTLIKIKADHRLSHLISDTNDALVIRHKLPLSSLGKYLGVLQYRSDAGFANGSKERSAPTLGNSDRVSLPGPVSSTRHIANTGLDENSRLPNLCLSNATWRLHSSAVALDRMKRCRKKTLTKRREGQLAQLAG